MNYIVFNFCGILSEKIVDLEIEQAKMLSSKQSKTIHKEMLPKLELLVRMCITSSSIHAESHRRHQQMLRKLSKSLHRWVC
jgi:hypothetical protein